LKIAFSTSGNDLDAPMDTRFGRASRFLVYDLEEETFKVIDNSGSRSVTQGAGIQAAETVARSGAKALITGNCGPKAFSALSTAGIAVYNTNAPSVSSALEQYRAGRLVPVESPNVDGHWT